MHACVWLYAHVAVLFTDELPHRLCMVLTLPVTLTSVTSGTVSSSFLTTMRKSVVGWCQQQSKRAAVVSSPRKQPFFSFPLLSVRNISRIQMRKTLLCRFIWQTAHRSTAIVSRLSEAILRYHWLAHGLPSCTMKAWLMTTSFLVCSGARHSFG